MSWENSWWMSSINRYKGWLRRLKINAGLRGRRLISLSKISLKIWVLPAIPRWTFWDMKSRCFKNLWKVGKSWLMSWLQMSSIEMTLNQILMKRLSWEIDWKNRSSIWWGKLKCWRLKLVKNMKKISRKWWRSMMIKSRCWPKRLMIFRVRMID